MAAAERVKVALRVRPSFRDLSAQEEVPSALEVDGTTVRPNDGAEQRSVYHFDHCVVGTPANEVHDAELSSRVKPLLDDLLKGYSASVLAYGQTGSGKTHAMSALTDEALRHIFALADEAKASSSSKTITIDATYIECYCEELRDLLCAEGLPTATGTTRESTIAASPRPVQRARDSVNPASSRESTIAASPRPVYRSRDSVLPMVAPSPRLGVRDSRVVAAQKRRLGSVEDALAVLAEGAARRATASTQLNDSSSRSHALFTLELTIEQFRTPTQSPIVLRPTMTFVDLAGSERSSRTGASGERLKEANQINQGLLALSKVISALADGSPHVPYRDSKLTRLLQGSLGGNARTLMIACVSAEAADLTETVNTLKYASTARKIVNQPKRATDSQQAKMMELEQLTQTQVTLLTKQLDVIRQKQALIDQQSAELRRAKQLEAETEEALRASHSQCTRLATQLKRREVKKAEPPPQPPAATDDATQTDATTAALAALSARQELADAKAVIGTMQAAMEAMKGTMEGELEVAHAAAKQATAETKALKAAMEAIKGTMEGELEAAHAAALSDVQATEDVAAGDKAAAVKAAIDDAMAIANEANECAIEVAVEMAVLQAKQDAAEEMAAALETAHADKDAALARAEEAVHAAAERATAVTEAAAKEATDAREAAAEALQKVEEAQRQRDESVEAKGHAERSVERQVAAALEAAALHEERAKEADARLAEGLAALETTTAEAKAAKAEAKAAKAEAETAKAEAEAAKVEAEAAKAVADAAKTAKAEVEAAKAEAEAAKAVAEAAKTEAETAKAEVEAANTAKVEAEAALELHRKDSEAAAVAIRKDAEAAAAAAVADSQAARAGEAAARQELERAREELTSEMEQKAAMEASAQLADEALAAAKAEARTLEQQLASVQAEAAEARAATLKAEAKAAECGAQAKEEAEAPSQSPAQGRKQGIGKVCLSPWSKRDIAFAELEPDDVEDEDQNLAEDAAKDGKWKDEAELRAPSMKMYHLRAELEARGLNPKGRSKEELIQRLLAAAQDAAKNEAYDVSDTLARPSSPSSSLIQPAAEQRRRTVLGEVQCNGEQDIEADGEKSPHRSGKTRATRSSTARMSTAPARSSRLRPLVDV